MNSAKKTGIIKFVHKLPIFIQEQLLGLGFLQRKLTYITNLPGMLPMLDKEYKQSQHLQAELLKRNIIGTKSIFINMGGTMLHALYLPPKNGKLVIAFHGIKGNWLNNPVIQPISPNDTDYDPSYRMELLQEFAADGFGFLACSMPGFEPSRGGASEENFINACEVFANYTKNLAEKSAIPAENIIVCGESLGGAIAAIFAAKMTAKKYPPGVVSLIATFDSLINMTNNEFPIFTRHQLAEKLTEKLDTCATITKLDKEKTYLHMVTTDNDTIIPLHNTLNLLNIARELGFNVLYHHTPGNHTTWNTGLVGNSRKLAHSARENGIKIALHHTVTDIEQLLATR